MQKRHSNRMAFLFLIIDILVVERLVFERDIPVCYVIFYRHFAMQRAGYDSLFWGEKHRGYTAFPTNHTPSIRYRFEQSGEELCLLPAPYWSKATFVAQK